MCSTGLLGVAVAVAGVRALLCDTARHAAVIADGAKGAPAGAVALIEPEAVATAVDGDIRATANTMAAFQHALDPEQARDDRP